LGANARYLLSRFAARVLSTSFPYGTLIINLAGSLVLGFFLVWTTERVLADPRWRMFVAIGFCGSFTTFSSYAFESFGFLEQGHWWLLAANVLSNNVLCLAAVLAGAALARVL
jgi:CrcB protein